jgi:hypothetical protein
MEDLYEYIYAQTTLFSRSFFHDSAVMKGRGHTELTNAGENRFYLSR